MPGHSGLRSCSAPARLRSRLQGATAGRQDSDRSAPVGREAGFRGGKRPPESRPGPSASFIGKKTAGSFPCRLFRSRAVQPAFPCRAPGPAAENRKPGFEASIFRFFFYLCAKEETMTRHKAYENSVCGAGFGRNADFSGAPLRPEDPGLPGFTHHARETSWLRRHPQHRQGQRRAYVVQRLRPRDCPPNPLRNS